MLVAHGRRPLRQDSIDRQRASEQDGFDVGQAPEIHEYDFGDVAFRSGDQLSFILSDDPLVAASNAAFEDPEAFRDHLFEAPMITGTILETGRLSAPCLVERRETFRAFDERKEHPSANASFGNTGAADRPAALEEEASVSAFITTRIQTRDYDRWRPMFDQDRPRAREKAAVQQVLRSVDDPNPVRGVVLSLRVVERPRWRFSGAGERQTAEPRSDLCCS